MQELHEIGAAVEFKDYYAVLGLEKAATEDEIKRAYRKLARKYHPDVSQEPDAAAHFKEIAEAYQVLKDPERRAAYDDVGNRYRQGREFNPPPGWDSGFEFGGRGFDEGADFTQSDFFEMLFGTHAARSRQAHAAAHAAGRDHHAKIQIDVQDSYLGGRRAISLRIPEADATGKLHIVERQIDVNIPKGIAEGQHLRLAGLGGAGYDGQPAGDLYLEIEFAPHPIFHVDARDVYVDVPVAPWEAALGARIKVPTPDGAVEMAVPAGSSAGRKLRLKGKGLPGKSPGDLYMTLSIALPPADTPASQDAYRTWARACSDFNPRRSFED